MKLLLFTFFMSSIAFAGGQNVGNGGDLIICKKTSANKLEGQLALDYVLTLGNNDSGLTEVRNWESSMYRIRKNLERSVPELLSSFDEFNRFIKNRDKSQPRLWESTPFGLIHVMDQSFPSAVQLPINCREGDKIPLIRAIVRQHPEFSGSKTIVYKYIEESFDKMEKESPLQLSFLLVHEWLWDLSDNVDRNRRLNRFFHSADFDKMNSIQINKTLKSLGLNVKDLPIIVDRNLSAAIDSSRPGQTLILKPGVYSVRSLAIRHDLTIKGDGNVNEIIIDTYDDFVINAQSAVLQNLTIKRQTYNDGDSEVQPALRIMSKNVSIAKCHIKGGNFGISVEDDAELSLEDSRVESDSAAIYVKGSGSFLRNYLLSSRAFLFSSPGTTDIIDNTFDILNNSPFGGDKPRGQIKNNKTITDGKN